jgi:hypothetical protein
MKIHIKNCHALNSRSFYIILNSTELDDKSIKGIKKKHPKSEEQQYLTLSLFAPYAPACLLDDSAHIPCLLNFLDVSIVATCNHLILTPSLY